MKHRSPRDAVRARYEVLEPPDTMSQVDRLYRWLTHDVSPASSRALATAMVHAEPEYALRIADILVKRRHETAWAGLVAGFDRLPRGVQQELAAQPDLLRAGISGAMKLPGTRAQMNALRLLAAHPTPQLSYLLADALRMPEDDVREAAAAALRCSATRALPEQGVDPAAAADPARRSEHRELIRALREALRTFDLHRRSDVLELCLWFAKDLDDALWETLEEPRSTAGFVVEQRLSDWSSPRLAGFLLLALAQTAWRKPALGMLASWSEPAALIALLRNSDLLTRAPIRRALHQLRSPPWLVQGLSRMPTLPADARGQLPYWIGALGLTEGERFRLLRRWVGSTLPELKRSAIYAAADLGGAAALEILTEAAGQPGPMGRFAKWYVVGHQVLTASRRPRTEANGTRSAPPPHAARGPRQ
jgi:hypothetical protein